MVLTEARVEEMIVEALDAALEAAGPDLVNAICDQLVEVIEDRLNHFRATLPDRVSSMQSKINQQNLRR